MTQEVKYQIFVGEVLASLGFANLAEPISEEEERTLRMEWNRFADMLLTRADLVEYFFTGDELNDDVIERMVECYRTGRKARVSSIDYDRSVRRDAWEQLRQTVERENLLDPMPQTAQAFLDVITGKAKTPVTILSMSRFSYLMGKLHFHKLIGYGWQKALSASGCVYGPKGRLVTQGSFSSSKNRVNEDQGEEYTRLNDAVKKLRASRG